METAYVLMREMKVALPAYVWKLLLGPVYHHPDDALEAEYEFQHEEDEYYYEDEYDPHGAAERQRSRSIAQI